MNSGILFINTSRKVSGAELSFAELLNGIDIAKFDSYVVTCYNDKLISLLAEYKNLIILPFIELKKSLNLIYVIRVLINVLINSYRISSFIKRNNIAVIYANTDNACIYAVAVKMFSGRKLIWHVRDNQRYYNFVLRFYSDQIICVSKHIAAQFRVPLYKKRVIYNGIDTDEWTPNHKPNFNLRKFLNISENTKIIAQISQITPWKNHKDFLYASRIINKKYPDVHFLIVGDCLSGKDIAYKNSLLKEIEGIDFRNKITFWGHQDDMISLMVQIDILVHPSVDEPFGRVAIEAMAMGKPVIAYDRGGPKEIITDGQTGYLVFPFVPEVLARKTLALLFDEKLRMQFGSKGRQRVDEIFNKKTQVSKIQGVFENICL